MESKMLDTVKVGDGMSQELKHYLRQQGKLCLQEGVLCWHGNQTRWNWNELQLVVPQECQPEAMHGTHNDVGHLGLKWMLDIVQDQFYWPNLEDDATQLKWTCEHCWRLKGRQDKEDLYPLLATTTKAIVTPTQTVKATANAFWNEFVTNYGFPEKLLTDQGHNWAD